MDITTSAELYRETSGPLLNFLGVAAILLIILPSAALIGHRVGRLGRHKTIAEGKDVDLEAGHASLGGILALLGLLVAFSFGNALNIAETRKTTGVQEAAALSTVFDRADYIEGPGRIELKRAVLDYAKTRVVPTDGGLNSPEEVLRFLETTLQSQASLWPLVLKVTADPVPPHMKTFIAGAMNEALDAHLFRMQAFYIPVTSITQATLTAAAVAALFMLGNRSGLVGRNLTWRTFAFAGFLLAVMITIVDLHRGGEGLIRFDQTALLTAIFEMEAAL